MAGGTRVFSPEVLKWSRMNRTLSDEQFAGKVGISVAQLKQIEANGEMTDEVAFRWARETRTMTLDLVGDTPPPARPIGATKEEQEAILTLARANHMNGWYNADDDRFEIGDDWTDWYDHYSEVDDGFRRFLSDMNTLTMVATEALSDAYHISIWREKENTLVEIIYDEEGNEPHFTAEAVGINETAVSRAFGLALASYLKHQETLK